MKTAAKVFIVLGMIFTFYLIFPIVVGAIAFKKLNESTSIKDLHNFGIVTLFFCSFLGGIFMIAMGEDEIGRNAENPAVVKYKTVEMPKEEQRALNCDTASATRRLMISIVLLSFICLLLSLATIPLLFEEYYIQYSWGPYYYYPYAGGVWFNIFQGSLQIIFALIPIIIYLCNGKWVNKTCCGFLIFCIPVYMVCCNLSICSLFITEKIHFLFVLIMLIEFALFIFCIVTVTLNRKVLRTKTKLKVVTSPLEMKLAEITRLLKSNIISQDEYDKMRESIISEFH